MSDIKAKKYSSEFKESSVKLAQESKNTIAQTARDLGIKISTLHTWITKQSGVKTIKAANDDQNLQEELKKLKKEIAQITIERDILKKAAAYFAKQTL
jgi:transposase